EVSATYLGLQFFLTGGMSRTDRHLELFGGPSSDHHGVLLLDEGHDGQVEFVTAHTDGLGGDDSSHGDDGDLGGAPADVHHHVPGGFVDRKFRTDGRGHGFFDDVDPARTRLVARLLDRAVLDRGDTAGYGHDDAWFGEVASSVDLLDEVAKHPLGDLEVGDDAVLEWADSSDVGRGAADHLLGLGPDGDDLARCRVDRDHRGLVQHDATPTHV